MRRPSRPAEARRGRRRLTASCLLLGGVLVLILAAQTALDRRTHDPDASEPERSPSPAPGSPNRPSTDPTSDPSMGPTSIPSPSGPSPTASPAPTPPVTPPTTPAVPRAGTGNFAVADGSSGQVGSGTVLRYRVEVENGLPVRPEEFARGVEQVLADPRGWVNEGAHAFRRDPGARTRVVLANPDSVDRLCAPLKTRGRLSCRNGDDVVLNARRWFNGSRAFGPDLAAYRVYLINHEVGHRLGKSHQSCPAPRRSAPVMLQQTVSLQACRANPWPR